MLLLGPPGGELRIGYLVVSVFVPEQHWPQHAPHAQLVVIVVTTVFAIDRSSKRCADQSVARSELRAEVRGDERDRDEQWEQRNNDRQLQQAAHAEEPRPADPERKGLRSAE